MITLISIFILCRTDPGGKVLEYEFNEDVLVRRQKQIEFGKKTDGYVRYLKMVPK